MRGWNWTRVDRFERGGDVVEMGYVYGEVRLTVRDDTDFRLFGPTSREDQAKFDEFMDLTK